MSNYYQLISNISLIKLGRTPDTFSDTTKRRYNKIKDGISNALSELFLSRDFNFRDGNQTFKTVSGLNKYVNNYGVVNDIYYNKQRLTYSPNIDNDVLLNTTVTGTPTSYIIYNNCIILYPIPNGVYTLTVLSKIDKSVKQIHTVDDLSVSGQTILYLSSTTGLDTGDILTINKNSINEESVIISSVVEDEYIITEDNLSYSHVSNESVEKYKDLLEYETDEPNFPDLYHKIIEFHTLRQLYINNPPKLAKYQDLLNNAINNVVINDRGTINNRPRFIFRY